MTETAPKLTRSEGQHWTEEDDRELVSLWKDGKTATQIAALLPGGRKRNSILSRIHRKHKDIGRKPPQPRRARQNGPSRLPQRMRTVSVPRLTADDASRISIDIAFPQGLYHYDEPVKPEPSPDTAIDIMAVRDGLCRFPYGGRAPYKFCGEPTEAGVSYCEYHCRIAYNGLPQRIRNQHPRDRRYQWENGR